MQIDIDAVRNKYSAKRYETLQEACNSYGKDLSEWKFIETSARLQPGNGKDILAIFECTLTKEGDETIYITEIIDVHRLAYSYSFRYGEETVIPDDEEGSEET